MSGHYHSKGGGYEYVARSFYEAAGLATDDLQDPTWVKWCDCAEGESECDSSERPTATTGEAGGSDDGRL